MQSHSAGNNKAEIHGIFPTPVYLSKLNREFTKKELDCINKQIKFCRANAGNRHTKDNYIFKSIKELKNLEQVINKHIKDYFDKIIRTSNKVTPYITQSWINYTKENEFHHQHSHANSFLSGCLYINADKKTDSIKFWKREQTQPIQLETKEFSVLNSATWKFPVETGDIIIFPSSTTHSVDNKLGKHIRISVSFNVFIKGTLGNHKQLTELKL